MDQKTSELRDKLFPTVTHGAISVFFITEILSGNINAY
jgi:hypothetical protein